MIHLLTKPGNIRIDSIEEKSIPVNKVSVSMLRLDLVHPVISGNKIFKLHYFLEEAIHSKDKLIITFGGAYSNHLAATAFACKESGLQCIGIVRGEEPKILSPTLAFCLANNMKLEFISRAAFKKINEKSFIDILSKKYGKYVLIPEGGFSEFGVKGAGLIFNYFNQANYTHLCCPIGTATTFAGLLNGAKKELSVTGFPVLKNLVDINERLLTLKVPVTKKYTIIDTYHFGGYAKKNEDLISFLNSFYQNNKIPLDFVYTGKMMFGVLDLIKKKFFPPGSNILCIHTGGLQGNQSLPVNSLNF